MHTCVCGVRLTPAVHSCAGVLSAGRGLQWLLSTLALPEAEEVCTSAQALLVCARDMRLYSGDVRTQARLWKALQQLLASYRLWAGHQQPGQPAPALPDPVPDPEVELTPEEQQELDARIRNWPRYPAELFDSMYTAEYRQKKEEQERRLQ